MSDRESTNMTVSKVRQGAGEPACMLICFYCRADKEQKGKPTPLINLGLKLMFGRNNSKRALLLPGSVGRYSYSTCAGYCVASDQTGAYGLD